MVKTRYFLFLFVLIGLPFIAEAQNRRIFIEGTASNAQHQIFFLQNFRTEGAGAGYTITETRAEAAYTFRFSVLPNVITYDDGTQGLPEPDEPQFNIQINLIDNETSDELVSFGFQYINLDDMLEFTQFLFLRAAINIPNGFDAETIVVEELDDGWRNKWLYLRVSADYSITFNQLLPEGLRVPYSVYDGDINTTTVFTSTDNRTFALPAATVGIQIQFLDWLSLEPHAHAIYDHEALDFSLAAGARLLFPLKSVRNVLMEPYLAISFPIPMTISPEFSSYPLFTYGGGMQFGIRGGSSGVLFFDLSYMYSHEDVVLKNPYGDRYPKPEEIHYRYSAIRLAIGYKFGFINR